MQFWNMKILPLMPVLKEIYCEGHTKVSESIRVKKNLRETKL